jgi:deoxyhypusine synthase
MSRGPVSTFLEKNYKHFNAATIIDAAKSYENQLKQGNKMMITLAGAMSTAELGITLAEMIREDKVHIISCTGANLEEDIFNLIAHKSYERVPHYRELNAQDELALRNRGLNRVTDTCIPEAEAFRKLDTCLINLWKKAETNEQRFFPHEYMYEVLRSKALTQCYEIDPKNSWMLAAAEKNIPIIVPGWEDSTMGNVFAAECLKKIVNPSTVKTGIEYMTWLMDWYIKTTENCGIGFFQIGGGIAGDFPICVVPALTNDFQDKETKPWSYFCQISDSTTSYGSYSGAVPNEKITWYKLTPETPRFMIESDATIVAPLIFAWLLGY